MLLPLFSNFTFVRLIRRFRRNRSGSAAVEFAFIAPIFFALIFALFETALVFFAGQVLENAAQDSGRLVYVYQGTGALPRATFMSDFCPRVNILFTCNGNFDVDLQSYPPGTAVPTSAPYDSAGNITTPLTWNPPPQGSTNTVVLRVFYKWPLIVTGLGYNIANVNRGMSNSARLLTAASAFRVEP